MWRQNIKPSTGPSSNLGTLCDCIGHMPRKPAPCTLLFWHCPLRSHSKPWYPKVNILTVQWMLLCFGLQVQMLQLGFQREYVKLYITHCWGVVSNMSGLWSQASPEFSFSSSVMLRIVLVVKKSALACCKSCHLGHRVGFCLASDQEHPSSSRQNGTLNDDALGTTSFMLQLKLIYRQAPGEGHVTMAELIRTGHFSCHRDWFRGGCVTHQRLGAHWDVFFLQLCEGDAHRSLMDSKGGKM